MNETVARLEGSDDIARKLLRVTLANYFAGALMMPYERFSEAAELSATTSSFSRLVSARASSRLLIASRRCRGKTPAAYHFFCSASNRRQRVEAVFFEPVSIRQFGRHLRNLEHPRHLLKSRPHSTQVIELPEGSQWFSIARTVRRSLTPWGSIEPRFAIGLGCEIKYARRLVYAKGLDLDKTEAAPIGVNCRLCDRPACRAAPPRRPFARCSSIIRRAASRRFLSRTFEAKAGPAALRDRRDHWRKRNAARRAPRSRCACAGANDGAPKAVAIAKNRLVVPSIGLFIRTLTRRSQRLQMNLPLLDGERRFAHGFGQGRMRVAGAREILRRAAELHQHGGFGDQFARAGADDMDAENAVGPASARISRIRRCGASPARGHWR